MLLNVDKKSVLSSGLSSLLLLNGNSVTSVEVDEQDLIYDGQNSAIYNVIKINGNPVKGLCCKVYKDGFPSTLEGIVKKMGDNYMQAHDCKSLGAFPLFLFEAYNFFNRERLFCTIMNKIAGKTFDNLLKESAYLRLPMISELKICYQLVTTMEILNNLGIIHGDFGFDNVMIDMLNISDPVFYLIDFDAGAVTESMPPISEMKDVIELIPWENWEQKVQGEVVINRNSENYAVAAMIHCLLFGAGPFFFIDDVRNIPQYLKSNQSNRSWPYISDKESFFRKVIAKQYKAYLRKFESLSKNFQKNLSIVLQKGFMDVSFRKSPFEWKTIIESELNSTNVKVRQQRSVTSKPTFVHQTPIVRQPAGNQQTSAKKQSSSKQQTYPKSRLKKPNLQRIPFKWLTPSNKLITFSWSAVSNASKYEFVLYSKGGKIVYQRTTSSTWLSFSLGGSGLYSCKVRAGDNVGNWSEWSDAWRGLILNKEMAFSLKKNILDSWKKPKVRKSLFTALAVIILIIVISNLPNINKFLQHSSQNTQLNHSLQMIEKVDLISPKDGSKISGDSVDLVWPNSVNLVWSKVGGASKYELALKNKAGTRLNTDESFNSTSANVGLEAFSDGEKISWAVRAGDDNGNWGSWSDFWSFYISKKEETKNVLHIRSIPAGANVYINGENRGITPLVLEVESGSYKVKITKSGYESSEENVFVDNEKYYEVKLKVTSNPQSKSTGISLDSNPTGAIVKINGNQVGKTPLSNYTLKGGNYTIQISKPGYLPYSIDVTVKVGEIKNLGSINLYKLPESNVPKPNGSIDLDSYPSNALIYIDGNLIPGYTPIINYSLTPGLHTIVISKFGYKDYIIQVQIISGERKDLGTVTLEQAP